MSSASLFWGRFNRRICVNTHLCDRKMIEIMLKTSEVETGYQSVQL